MTPVLGILVFAIVGVVVVVVVIGGTVQGRTPTRPQQLPPEATAALRIPLEPGVQQRVLELLGEGKKIEAIKEIRTATGYRLKEAKELAEALAAQDTAHGPGSSASPDSNQARTASGAADPTAGPNLAERARRLRAEGQETRAIRLVCDETGMGIPEAQTFLRSLL